MNGKNQNNHLPPLQLKLQTECYYECERSGLVVKIPGALSTASRAQIAIRLTAMVQDLLQEIDRSSERSLPMAPSQPAAVNGAVVAGGDYEPDDGENEESESEGEAADDEDEEEDEDEDEDDEEEDEAVGAYVPRRSARRIVRRRRGRPTSPNSPVRVLCPTCKAASGKPCLGRGTGKPVAHYHAARRQKILGVV